MVQPKETYKNIYQDLIDGCKRGDQKSYFQIYKLYYKAMYNTCIRIVGDPIDAEDIMQESFLAAFDKINTYSETVAFGAWLKKIVVNRSLDYLDRRKKLFDDIDEKFDLCDDIYDDTIIVEERETQVENVKKAIAELPEGYRIILSLYLLEGYDHDEIAEIMKISSNTSRSQLSRAKQKLKGILQNNKMN